jgi:serine/threonine protein kinase
MQKDPTRRLTAQDALLHPWILQYDDDDGDDGDDDDASMISDDYKLSCYHNFIEQDITRPALPNGMRT